jgi:molybdopterin synthase catalytic subunit
VEQIERKIQDIGRDRQRDHKVQRVSVWHVVGGIALAGLAAVVIANLRDVKRYIKISTM